MGVQEGTTELLHNELGHTGVLSVWASGKDLSVGRNNLSRDPLYAFVTHYHIERETMVRKSNDSDN
jgi:hypothetical protein